MEIINLNKQDLEDLQKYNEQGAEAIIYKYNKDNVLKIYNSDDELYLLKKYYKMTALEPELLPDNIVKPNAIINIDNTFKGFKMPYIPSNKTLLDIVDYQNKYKIMILKELSNTLKICHYKKIIFGDYHSDNILIYKDRPYHIDIDSIQFKGYSDELVSKLLFHLGIEKPSKKADIIALHYYSFYLLTGLKLDIKNPLSWNYIIGQTALPSNVKKIFMNMLDLPRGIYIGDYIDELYGAKPKEELNITLIRKLFS